MTQSKCKLNIDFNTDEILYQSNSGHEKAIRVAYEDLSKNPELLDRFSGRDGYFVGILYASKVLWKLSITNDKKYNYFFICNFIFYYIVY